jgi:hypothetical protein
MESSSCHLERWAGRRDVPCPTDRCAFWSDGCAVEGLSADVASSPDVAATLLELRLRLGTPAHVSLLPPGLRA